MLAAFAALLIGLFTPGMVGSASAAACATSSPTSGNCTVGANLTVTAGTLSIESSPNLYWNVVGTGYDQWTSGSASTLSSCAASNQVTTCSGGTRPSLLVLDGTGSGSGWALSEYVSSSTLPTGAVLDFNGAGSTTIGNSTASPVGTDPFSGTTPSNICDYGSTCTVATPASSCSHSGIGFTSCPSAPVSMLGATSSTSQVDLYSANTSSGLGAICFASGTATGSGCAGATLTDFYNLGIRGNTPAAASDTATVNLAVNSGP